MIPSVLSLTEALLEDSALWHHEAMPFTAHLTPGLARVLVVAGDNCSGKSLLVESLRAWASNEEGVRYDGISISIRERTGSGLNEMAGMRRAFIFGNEMDQSTGAVSVRVTGMAFKTLAARGDENIAALMVLDEPELGLADGYAGALGEFIGQRAAEVPENVMGAVIVTHSKALAARLLQGLGQTPSFVHMGRPLTYEQWLAETPHKSVEDLEQLKEANSNGRSAVGKVLAAIRALPK